MYYTDPELTAQAKTIEARMIDAVKNNKCTFILMAEVEELYKRQYLNDNDFNFLTDIELIKQIYC